MARSIGFEVRSNSSIDNAVPMSEAAESYDLDILNGATMVRTITGLTLWTLQLHGARAML